MTPPANMALVGRHEARGSASAPAEARQPDLEQLNKLEAKLEEERIRLWQLHETLELDKVCSRGRGSGLISCP
jgi:hypothetical protein